MDNKNITTQSKIRVLCFSTLDQFACRIMIETIIYASAINDSINLYPFSIVSNPKYNTQQTKRHTIPQNA